MFSRSLFFHCRSFSPCIGGRQHFSFCHRRYKIFMLFFQQKMSPLFFISRSRSLSLFFSLSFAGLRIFLFSVFRIALYSKFVEMTINLRLILQKTWIQKQFPLSGFVFSCPCITRRGWLCNFPPKKPRLAFGLPCLLIDYLTLVRLWYRRTVGRTVT